MVLKETKTMITLRRRSVRTNLYALLTVLALVTTTVAVTPGSAAAQASTSCGSPPAGMNVIESDAGQIRGTDGDDFICGGPSQNVIRGLAGNDIVYGGGGDDQLIGGGGRDELYGGRGDDEILGQRGADDLRGGAGSDTILGGRGNDDLTGGPGDDQLRGGKGSDHLVGAAGDDILRGGGGSDSFDGGEGNNTVHSDQDDISHDAAAPADAESNIALLHSNPTRNTQFDNNPFRDVPMRDIETSDLTVNRDIYSEALLNTDTSGFFRVKCELSHFAYDDPIVFPGQPGRAHLHMFFGNTEANAYSTFDSLLNTGTGTCNGEDLNRTAYWVPALLDSGGNALVPFEIMVYYKNDNFRLNGANELVSPFPDNLQMIAGNSGATEPQTDFTGDYEIIPSVSFLCGPAYGNAQRSALIPECNGTGQGPYLGNALEMQIAFPQCFDPSSGTYLADQSHVSYSEGGYFGVRCPDSHPEDLSSVMYRIFFNPDDYGGSLSNLHLSSDVKPDEILPGGTTLHADWFGAWHPETMDLWVENCNNTQADCEVGLLGRSPAVSLVERQQNFYPSGYRAPAEQLVALCPGKVFDSSDPVRSVSGCRHH